MILKNKTLYIVSTPIGNIFDFSQRAIFILKNVDIIATEDSRKIGLLLKFLNIKCKLLSLNNYNEITSTYLIINYINNKKKIALISDAGTPLINDPGFFLINYAYKNKIKIKSIPGVSSLTTILTLSKIKIKKFFFAGFIPKNKKIKKIFIKNNINKNKSIICFDNSKRLLNTLYNIKNNINKNIKILIFKNITKNSEKIFFLNLNYLYLIIKNKYINNLKYGEITILIEKKIKKKNITNTINLNKKKLKIF